MKQQKKDQGSTLLLVVVAVALISILATVAISMSVANLQMKSIENKAKKNFYSAESAVEELKMGVSKDISSLIQKAYVKTLSSYSDTSLGTKDLEFKKCLMEEYIKRYANAKTLAKSISLEYGTSEYDTEQLRSLLTNTYGSTTITSKAGARLEWSFISGDNDRQFICFQDLMIEYRNEEDYISRIQMDLKVAVPDVNLNFIEGLPTFTEYGIIADQGIVTKKEATIIGNVFAGTNGILADGFGSALTIQANQVITKESICVNDGGVMTIQSLSNLRELEVWAKDMETCGRAVTDQYPGTLIVDGNVYIADDTTLNAKNSKVTVTGSYYGFGYGNTPETSSALIVNRENCTLDLSGLRTLFVAGRAYIEPLGEVQEEDNRYISTGESISIKASQGAYRLPSACIGISKDGTRKMGVTNPMPAATYQDLIAQQGVLVVDTSYQLPSSNKTLADFVDKDHPFVTIFDNVGVSTYVYLYPNFKDGDAANSYMQLMAKNKLTMDAVKDRMSQFGAKIYLPDTILGKNQGIRSIGNILGSIKENEEPKLYQSQMTGTLSPEVRKEADGLVQMYTAYCKKLRPSITSEEMAYETMFDALLIQTTGEKENPGVDELLSERNPLLQTDLESGGYLIVDGDLELDERVDANVHLVIATGNVTVGRDFSGLIISKGNVSLLDKVKVNADPSVLYEMLSKQEIRSIFREYKGLASGLVDKENEPLDIAALVTINNWNTK